MSVLSPKQLIAGLRAITQQPTQELVESKDLQTQIAAEARKVFLTFEKPDDAVARLLLSQPVESITVRIAIDLKLFYLLSEDPKSLQTLVETTGAEELLLSKYKAVLNIVILTFIIGRVIRSLVVFGAIKDEGDSTYSLSPSFKSFGNQDFATTIARCGDFLNPAYGALPALLQSNGYKSPSDHRHTAVQSAYNAIGQDLVQILTNRPESAQAFGTLMSTWGEGNSLIQDLFPIQQKLSEHFDQDDDSVMWIDVGGGYGQKTVALKRAFPDLRGRFIVQDLPGTVKNTPKVGGIENMAHDFFTEQPIKGARAYYIRQCLHNWPAESCLTILTELRKAMKPGYSKLFVHELIVSDQKPSPWVITQDFNMMTLCGTMERTAAQWEEMLQNAGLKVVCVYQPSDGVSEGVIEAEVSS